LGQNLKKNGHVILTTHIRVPSNLSSVFAMPAPDIFYLHLATVASAIPDMLLRASK